MSDLIRTDDADLRFGWKPGTAGRLVRRGELPHYVLPDGAVRLRWEELEGLVRYVPAGRPLALAAGGADAR